MLLVRAVFAVLESGPRTPDLGGTNTTMDVTNAILAKLKTY
jgi:isocitrate/isopropylmalate dehydrogenase